VEKSQRSTFEQFDLFFRYYSGLFEIYFLTIFLVRMKIDEETLYLDKQHYAKWVIPKNPRQHNQKEIRTFAVQFQCQMSIMMFFLNFLLFFTFLTNWLITPCQKVHESGHMLRLANCFVSSTSFRLSDTYRISKMLHFCADRVHKEEKPFTIRSLLTIINQLFNF
jgi:hypothetical protein